METVGYALFDTPVGRCAIAWRGGSVVGVHLPEADDAATRARFLRRLDQAREQAPPPWVEAVIERIGALLSAEPADFSGVAFDFGAAPAFDRAVYAEACRIPPGQSITYGELAARLGAPGAARAVGGALGRNPIPILVPCHRIAAAGGKPGGFSAPGGVVTKARLLRLEGARGPDQASLFDPLDLAQPRPRPQAARASRERR